MFVNLFVLVGLLVVVFYCFGCFMFITVAAVNSVVICVRCIFVF